MKLTPKQKSDVIRDVGHAAGFPLRHLAIISAGLRDTPTLAALSKATGNATVLSGSIGVGKTVAATQWGMDEALKFVEEADYLFSPLHPTGTISARFVTAPELTRFDRFSIDEVRRIKSVKRLVVDDLGEEYADNKGAFLSLLSEILAYRMANGRRTLITTNLDAETFKIRYDARTIDRIREDGAFLSFGGESLRGVA